MNKTLQLIGLIAFLSSCVKKETQGPLKTGSTDNVVHGSESIDHSTIADCSVLLEKKDTILSTGDFIKYMEKGKLIKIEWGNEHFKRTFGNNYTCNTAPHWIPSISWSTSKYIGLEYGCGSPCWGIVILPLTPTDSVIERMYDFDKDLSRNLIVYLGDEGLQCAYY